MLGRLDRVGFLHVVGKDEDGHAALRHCDPLRAINQMARLRGYGAGAHECADIVHKRGEVDLLLLATAQRRTNLLPTIASTGCRSSLAWYKSFSRWMARPVPMRQGKHRPRP